MKEPNKSYDLNLIEGIKYKAEFNFISASSTDIEGQKAYQWREMNFLNCTNNILNQTSNFDIKNKRLGILKDISDDYYKRIKKAMDKAASDPATTIKLENQ